MLHQASRRRTHARRAFTLLEVIIAVTIVALLATILVPNVTRWLGVATNRKDQADVNRLAQTVRRDKTFFFSKTSRSDRPTRS